MVGLDLPTSVLPLPKIIKAYPPNFNELAKVFPIKGKPGIVFAYGDYIYNPSGQRLSPEIVAHEETHCARQKDAETHLWWHAYCTWPDFRLNEEVIAHRAEWDRWRDIWPSRMDEKELDRLASRLSSPLYGSLISYECAKQKITQRGIDALY